MAAAPPESGEVKLGPATLKEGYLLKRQRGKSNHADFRKLKFQQRFISLTQDALHYYVDQKKGEKKGEFPVDRMKIVEKVPDTTFQKPLCFQIGDEKEVMYFKVKSEDERREWIETFRIAANLKGNAMLSHFHHGAYGQVHQQKWSCCNAANRNSQGCQRTPTQYNTPRQHHRTSSLRAESRSQHKESRRQYSSVYGRKAPRSTDDPVHDDDRLDSSGFSQSLPTTTPSPLSQDGHRPPLSIIHQDSQEENFEDAQCHGDIEPAAKRIPDSKSMQSIHSVGRISIDSGFDAGSVSRFGGSQTSIATAAVHGVSPSPSLHHRLNMQTDLSKETINELKSSSECETQTTRSQVAEEPLWAFNNLPMKDTNKEIKFTLFRSADKLALIYENGSVDLMGIGKSDEPVTTILRSSESMFGSVDMWTKYIAVGTPGLKLVNIDSSGSLDLKGSKKGWDHPHLVAFTPKGHLISYSQSQPDSIKIWPKVDTLWSSNRGERHLLTLKDVNDVDSLAVSPNPSQSLLVVGTRKRMQIYDYEKQVLSWELNVGTEKTVISFSPTGRYIAVANGKQLNIHDVESGSISFPFPKFDSAISSLAYNPWPEAAHLAVGLSNGRIHVYDVGTSAPDSKPVILENKSLASEAISSLTYSKDGRTLATVSGNKVVTLWKVPVESRREKQHVTLVRGGELEVDSEGKQYISPEDGYAISIPPGAIPKGKTITFKHGVVTDGPFGPFEFPTGVRPVSAILSLHPTTEEVLLKPIELALPHFIHCETQDQCNRLAVFKADCHLKGGKDRKQMYSFKEMTGVNLCLGMYRGDHNYPDGIPYARFTTDHSCYWCLCERYSQEDTDRAIFSLIEVRPKVLDPSEDAVIHFCLPYFLPTCHKTIREQYPDDRYELSIQNVKFSPDDSETGPAIGVNFNERLGGWLFSLQGGSDKRIYQDEVCFWDYPTPLYLKHMCEEKLYPPRFSVCLRALVRPYDEVKAEFTFPGAVLFPGRAEPVAMVHLPLAAQRLTVSTGHPVSRVNSGHSVVSDNVFRAPVLNGPATASPQRQQSLQPAAQAFKKCMCDLDDLHPSKLALNLFSNNLIDEPVFKSIQESMMSSAKDEMVLRTQILLKVYNALKADSRLSTPLQEALRKLKPESAVKFSSEMSRLSREGSLTSSCSLATAPERLSSEAEAITADNIIVEEQSTSLDQVASDTQFALAPYTPIQFEDNLMGTLTFNTQTSLTPCSADQSSTEANPVAESERITEQESVNITAATD